MNVRHDIGRAGVLMAANFAGMALPLVALPVLAHRLGAHAFGLVVLAQGIGMLPVLLVDAGFNTESMRATGSAGTPAPLQPLLDNLIARCRIGAIAAAGTLLVGLAVPGLPLVFVAVALLQLAGTLAFPQWWLIATGATRQLLALQLAGRALAVAAVFWLVRTPDDALLATALQCGATLLSGLGFIVWRLAPRRHEFAALDPHGHRALASRVLPAAGSGFAVALSAQAPQLFLGFGADMRQVGLFAAGDKIARAAVFAFGAIGQSFLAPVARHSHENDATARALAIRVILATLVLATLAGAVVAASARSVVPRLFGAEFAEAAAVLVLFGAWLPSNATRRTFLDLRFAANGRQDLIARCQYVEATAVMACCGLGAALAGATGAATGMLAAETAAWAMLVACHRRSGGPS